MSCVQTHSFSPTPSRLPRLARPRYSRTKRRKLGPRYVACQLYIAMTAVPRLRLGHSCDSSTSLIKRFGLNFRCLTTSTMMTTAGAKSRSTQGDAVRSFLHVFPGSQSCIGARQIRRGALKTCACMQVRLRFSRIARVVLARAFLLTWRCRKCAGPIKHAES